MKWFLKHRIKLMIIFCICSVLLIAILLFFVNRRPATRKENEVLQLSFSIGETLSGYPVTDYEGERIDISEITELPTMVIFGMDGCKDCIEDLPSYELLFSLYDSDSLSIKFIWDDKIPQAKMDVMGIPPTASYSSEGEYKFTDWVPSYYLLANDGVILKQTTELIEAVEFLKDYEILSENLEATFQGKDLLLGIDRCGSCKSAYEKLLKEDNSFIYVLGGVETTEEKGILADPHWIISKAFGVESFPMYISVSGDGKITIEDIS